MKNSRWLVFVMATLVCIGALAAPAAPPQKGTIMLGDISTEVWGAYSIRQVLFPNEEWRFYVLVVPKDVRQGTLIKMAKEFYAKYPKIRARFFSDRKFIKQYVDRDMYVNDKTGKVKAVEFPDSEWVQNHLLANINNRSKTHNRQWMLEDRYGNSIQPLP